MVTDLGITLADAYIDQLMTDGAKAWTLDGFYCDGDGIAPNELTGSHIDVQLAEDPVDAVELGAGTSSRSSRSWCTRRPTVSSSTRPRSGTTKCTRSGKLRGDLHRPRGRHRPEPGVVLGLGPQYEWSPLGVVATVFDQSGDPMPGVDVDLSGYFQEGDAGFAVGYAYFYGTFTTDANGQIFVADAGPWGVWDVQARLTVSCPT